MKAYVRSKIQRVLKENSIATSLLKIAKFKTKYQKNVLYFVSMNTSTHVLRYRNTNYENCISRIDDFYFK